MAKYKPEYVQPGGYPARPRGMHKGLHFFIKHDSHHVRSYFKNATLSIFCIHRSLVSITYPDKGVISKILWT